MAKEARFLFLVLFVGLLLLVACSSTTGSESVGDTAPITDADDILGSGPIMPEEGAEEGPAGRGATSTTSDAAAACLSAPEAELARLINEYRASLNLPPVPLSKSMTLVAQQHAWDSTNNRNAWPAPPAGQTCNLHTWSGNVNPALQQGTWTAVCYTSDHANAQGMWDKPRELAGYPAIGVENSHWSSAGATPEGALTGWKNSPGHNAVITEQNGWTRPAAMGVGISGQYAHLWFGYVADPAGEAQLCSGGGVTQPTTAATAAPTAVPPTTEPAAEQPTAAAPTAEQPTVAAPTTVPPTTAAPTGTMLNQTGTITAGGTAQHTFDVVQGGSYTILITPAAGFDVAPEYECSGPTFSRSGTFDQGFEGEAETTSYTVAGNGTCTVTVGGYEGSTGDYTIVVTSP